ncbi:hypothetical protein [Oceanobacter antarcticus]|uniref:Uncharacterized protein n=1 Tax=Oceanobacter antarcticus TaxID=3133425 RepID=A0ABW8NKV3_9GAMM
MIRSFTVGYFLLLWRTRRQVVATGYYTVELTSVSGLEGVTGVTGVTG